MIQSIDVKSVLIPFIRGKTNLLKKATKNRPRGMMTMQLELTK